MHKDKRVWEMDVAHEVSVQLKRIADVSALVRVREPVGSSSRSRCRRATTTSPTCAPALPGGCNREREATADRGRWRLAWLAATLL